jgi:hypothetical protein
MRAVWFDSRAKQRRQRMRDNLSEGRTHEKANPALLRAVADICELLGHVILLAPIEQRDELCSFALTEVAAITDHVCGSNATQH